MISEEDVRKIARLAKLRLGPEEVALYQKQLLKILDSMAEIKTLDTASVPPTSSAVGLTNVLRPDVPSSFPEIEKLLEAAPEREGPYFKVKKVIE